MRRSRQAPELWSIAMATNYRVVEIVTSRSRLLLASFAHFVISFRRCCPSLYLLGAALLTSLVAPVIVSATPRTIVWIGPDSGPVELDDGYSSIIGDGTFNSIPPTWTSNVDFRYGNWYLPDTWHNITVLPTAEDTLVFARAVSSGNPITNRDWTVSAIQFDYSVPTVTLDSNPPGGGLANLTLNGDVPIRFNKIGETAVINFNVKLDAADATVFYAGDNLVWKNVRTPNKLVINGAFAGHNVNLSGGNAFTNNQESATFNGPIFLTDGNLNLLKGNVTINSVVAATRAVNLEDTTLTLAHPLSLTSLRTTGDNGATTVRDPGLGGNDGRLTLLPEFDGINNIVASGTLNIGVPVSAGRVSIDAPNGTVVYSGFVGFVANNAVQDTTVNSGTLVLDRTPGSDLVGSSLVVAAGARLVSIQGEQIANSAPVTLGAGATWALGGANFNETLAALTLNDATIARRLDDAGNALARGTLNLPQMPSLTGNVSIDANLNIGSQPFNFNVASGKQINFNGQLSGSSFTKSGAGTLVIGPDTTTTITDVTLNGGPTRVEASNFFKSTTDLALESTTLSLTGGNQRLRSLSFTGATIDDGGTGNLATLQLSQPTIDFTFANTLKADLLANGYHFFNVNNTTPFPGLTIPGTLTYTGTIFGAGVLKQGDGKLLLQDAKVLGSLDARAGTLVVGGTTSLGQLYVEPTANVVINPGSFNIGWLVAQQNMTFTQPTKFARISPTSGNTVALNNIDVGGSDILLDDAGKLIAASCVNLRSAKITSGTLDVSNLAMSHVDLAAGGSMQVSGPLTLGTTSSLDISTFNGTLSGGGLITAGDVWLQFKEQFHNVGTSSMSFTNTRVSFATPASGVSVNGNLTAEGATISVTGTAVTSPTSIVSLKNSNWSGGSDLTMKSLRVDGGTFSASVFDSTGAALTTTAGLTVTSGGIFAVRNANIGGGAVVEEQSSVTLSGEVSGSVAFKDQSVIDNRFAMGLHFHDSVTFEVGTTVKLTLIDPASPTFFDFDGPTLIGTPRIEFFSLQGMDGQIAIDLSTTTWDLPAGQYRLMDFSDAGYHQQFAFGTAYPTLNNFSFLPPQGTSGQLVMNGHILVYEVAVPEPSVLALAICALFLIQAARAQRLRVTRYQFLIQR